MRITRRIEFDAGHRLLKHEGKCKNIHGHRYAAELTVSSPLLDQSGRVVDFSILKEVVGEWINDKLDHAFIAQKGDPIIDWLEAHEQKHFVMADPPSAETLAFWIYTTAEVLLDPYKHTHKLRVEKVRLYETPTSWAEFEYPGLSL